MHVTRFVEAKPYEAKGHFLVSTLQLQGGSESETQCCTCGLSQFLPGGGAERSASPLEKTYVVLSGTVAINTDRSEAVLGPLDSCHLMPGEARSVRNPSNEVATVLVILSKPEAK